MSKQQHYMHGNDKCARSFLYSVFENTCAGYYIYGCLQACIHSSKYGVYSFFAGQYGVYSSEYRNQNQHVLEDLWINLINGVISSLIMGRRSIWIMRCTVLLWTINGRWFQTAVIQIVLGAAVSGIGIPISRFGAYSWFVSYPILGVGLRTNGNYWRLA
jgi:hypothetical protein